MQIKYQYKDFIEHITFEGMSLLTVFSSVQIYLYYFYYQNIDFLLILEQSITILEDKKWHWAYLFFLSALVPTCHID